MICFMVLCIIPPNIRLKTTIIAIRRWNADKPSAALDPYIPTWLTTSSANHRPANFFKSFFFFFFFETLEGNCEKWCNLMLNWCGSISNLKLPFLILEVQIITDIIYQSIMGMLTYFHSMSLRCSYMIFSVAYLYRLLRGLISLYIYIHIYIYSYISSSRIIFSRSLPRYIPRCVLGPLHISGIS